MSFQIGDRVFDTCSARTGTIDEVLTREPDQFARVLLDGDVVPTQLTHVAWLRPHVDVFPIAADNDPWRESEPSITAGVPCLARLQQQRANCSRDRGHSGHHVARFADQSVLARWPQEPAPKAGQRVGDEVVFPRYLSQCNILAGSRGTVSLIHTEKFFVTVNGTDYWFYNQHFGTDVVPAAEWDARQKRCGDEFLGRRCDLPTGHTGMHSGSIAGKPGQLLQTEPPPPARFDFLKDLTGDIIGSTANFTVAHITKSAVPVPATMGDFVASLKVVEVDRELFAARLAIALFEADNAVTVARVADDGRGGIGTEETRQRLVWRSGEAQRAAYMREAEALLKRAGELS